MFSIVNAKFIRLNAKFIRFKVKFAYKQVSFMAVSGRTDRGRL